MSPTGPGAPVVPAAPTDPRELALHLEICRLQAELEGLEARIHEVEAARSSGGAGYDPFVERAEELVERMVSSLYVSGRSEIAASSAATDEEAEALLHDARRRAQAILAEARGELATVLSARADAMDAARAAGLDVVDLTDGDHALALAPPPPESEAVGPSPSVDEAEPTAAEPTAVETGAEPEPETDESTEPAPVLVDPVGADLSALLAPPPPPPPGPTEPVDTTLLPPPPASPPSTDEVDAVDAVDAGLLSPPPRPAPVDEWIPPATGADEPPAGSLTAALVAARTESDRTDAAFDAWLAVGPTANTEAETTPELDADAPARPAWVRPLEAAIALVAVAVVVVLALLLVG